MLLQKIMYIYIYIYIEREREREREKDTGRPNCGLTSPTAPMLGKNSILGGDVNSLVKAAATYNLPPNL